jgi:hypothetical protein
MTNRMQDNNNEPRADSRVDADGVRLPPSPCPFCGRVNDAAMQVQPDGDDGAHRPSVGDFTVCFGCAALLAYDDGMMLRPVTVAERAAIADDDDAYRAVMHARGEVRRFRGRLN